MHREQCGVRAEFHGEVTVAHAVHRILRELRFTFRINEAEKSRDEFAIEWQRGTGNGSAAKRAHIHTLKTTDETLAIALQHFHVSEQVMREVHRLRALKVRVAGNHDRRILFAERHERALQLTQLSLVTLGEKN